MGIRVNSPTLLKVYIYVYSIDFPPRLALLQNCASPLWTLYYSLFSFNTVFSPIFSEQDAEGRGLVKRSIYP